MYRKTLRDIEARFYRKPGWKKGDSLSVKKRWRPKKRTAISTMFGADQDTGVLLHKVLKCPALKDICDGKPLRYRTGADGVERPVWTTTAASPVGFESRVWQQLRRSEKSVWVAETVDQLFHVVLWHRELPKTASPQDVWNSLLDLDARFKRLKGRIAGSFVGGFAMREVDRNRKGITIHMHFVCGTRGATVLKELIPNAWAKSSIEYDERMEADVKPVVLGHAERVLLYVAGTRRVGRLRFAKFLDGMIYVPWNRDSPFDRQGKERASQWRAKGTTDVQQMRLILAGLAYPRQQPRWQGAWNFTTKAGKALQKQLAIDRPTFANIQEVRPRRKSKTL